MKKIILISSFLGIVLSFSGVQKANAQMFIRPIAPVVVVRPYGGPFMGGWYRHPHYRRMMVAPVPMVYHRRRGVVIY